MFKKYDKLQKLNLWMALAHGVQFVLLMVLSSDFARTITTQYLEFDEVNQTLVQATGDLFDVRLVFLVAGFSFLSMFFHILIATVWFDSYKSGLKKGINKYRWFEYSLSASLMMVVVGILTGIFDASTLLMMFGLTAVMNLLGWVMEVHNQTTKDTNWLSYWIGCLAGILPWLVIVIYFAASTTLNGAQGPPTFVYFIWGSIFLFFNSFALNMYLQYKGIGKWKDYLYGERAYIWLSLVAKSALVWQVYAGTLQP
jgi:hypothetical protein